MSTKGTTVINHDKAKGNFSNHTDVEVPIDYNIEMDKIAALIEASHKCRQFISMETFNTQNKCCWNRKEVDVASRFLEVELGYTVGK